LIKSSLLLFVVALFNGMYLETITHLFSYNWRCPNVSLQHYVKKSGARGKGETIIPKEKQFVAGEKEYDGNFLKNKTKKTKNVSFHVFFLML